PPPTSSPGQASTPAAAASPPACATSWPLAAPAPPSRATLTSELRPIDPAATAHLRLAASRGRSAASPSRSAASCFSYLDCRMGEPLSRPAARFTPPEGLGRTRPLSGYTALGASYSRGHSWSRGQGAPPGKNQ